MATVNLEISTRLDSLRHALEADLPQMPVLLREIHKALASFPEQVTLLEPEQIALIIKGLEKQTMSGLAAAATKTTKATKAKLSKVTSDDLGF